MSILLRVLLTVFSLYTLVFTLTRIRRAQLRIEDSLFWIVLSFGIVLLSLFPGIAFAASRLLGIESPTNLVYLAFLFLLLLRSFRQTVKLSQLESKLTALTQANALLEKQVRERAGEESAARETALHH